MFVPQSSPIRTYPRSRRGALPPSSGSHLSSATCSSLPSSSINCRCRALVPLVIFTALLSLRDRTLMNQRNSGDAQSELPPLVTCPVVEVPAVRDKQVCLARAIFDRQVQQFLCSHCMLLGCRCELVTGRNASRTPRGGLVFFLTCCVSVQDTGGYEGHIFTGPHRLPTRDKRHSSETLTAADAHDDGAGRLRLLRHCWIVLRSAVILCHVRSLKSVDKG
jgi:hypothetical protein